ncbi:hypothetical protein JMJ77_0009942 [Colletotrichum scovillei]|uniref:Uncharacterized protein n=1 Tax=Colletotrichum scovillei TaxID=1209932 RepID=A0A9P7QQS7_9PEZI|nr:hypothetical protein JMJ78_0001014 [Colletotrichum scovillei]KAG7040838.1 hypothetical protein JMJ77_0009942 [Colletotrichum scovillei]KAG7060882.1 hypothetical protein JMJ76_0009955 [Colletotrichum scovillei]
MVRDGVVDARGRTLRGLHKHNRRSRRQQTETRATRPASGLQEGKGRSSEAGFAWMVSRVQPPNPSRAKE